MVLFAFFGGADVGFFENVESGNDMFDGSFDVSNSGFGGCFGHDIFDDIIGEEEFVVGYVELL